MEMDFGKTYADARRRLLTLEYDGVLVPFQNQPGLTIPDRSVKDVIDHLAADARNTVMLLSGRDKEHLDLHWSRRNLVLVAEHGAAHKPPGRDWSTFFEPDNEWIDEMEASVSQLVFQFGGSFTERRRHSLTWHYGNVIDLISSSEVQRIVASIRALPKSDHFAIYQRARSIELRSRGLTHPAFVRTWIGQQKFDFVMNVGTDESAFPIFELSNTGIPVTTTTGTAYLTSEVLSTQSEVFTLLKQLAGTKIFRKMSFWPFSRN
jgi:trehalose 6-phosphate synthase/phosphatase